jgi:GGDEF domain-containing protein
MEYNQQRERLLVDALNEAVVLLDPNGVIQYANPVACKMLGHPLDVVHNQKINEHIALDEQLENTQAICLRPIDSDTVKSTFICGDNVRKIKLPDPNGFALIWSPITELLNSRDTSTGLPDRDMLTQQLTALLNQINLTNPHSLIKIQITKKNGDPLGTVLVEQLESLMTDIAALLSPYIRQRDLLSRSDTDCFMLLLRGCDLEHAKAIALKLMAEINSYHEDYPDTHLPEWRVCAGVIPLIGGTSAETTFEQSKKACQQACMSNENIGVLHVGNWENLD